MRRGERPGWTKDGRSGAIKRLKFLALLSGFATASNLEKPRLVVFVSFGNFIDGANRVTNDKTSVPVGKIKVPEEGASIPRMRNALNVR